VGLTCVECHYGIAHTEPEGELGPKEIKAELKKDGKL
jgi:nitrate/TMAO reductase-like tetraheme cytochrome c subunit